MGKCQGERRKPKERGGKVTLGKEKTRKPRAEGVGGTP